jgi:hypothetical protein
MPVRRIVSRNISAYGECTTAVQLCSSTPIIQYIFIKKGRNQSSQYVRYIKEKFLNFNFLPVLLLAEPPYSEPFFISRFHFCFGVPSVVF